MNAFKSELHDLVARHVAAAPPARMLRLVETLADDTTVDTAPLILDVRPRFVRLDAAGKPTDGPHVAIYDRTTGLTWTAEPLRGGEGMDHATAIEACRRIERIDAALRAEANPCS